MTDQERITALERQVQSLLDERRNDFSTLKVFLKSIQVNGYVLLKEYSGVPSPAREGMLVYSDNKLRLCTVSGSPGTWVTVGTQT